MCWAAWRPHSHRPGASSCYVPVEAGRSVAKGRGWQRLVGLSKLFQSHELLESKEPKAPSSHKNIFPSTILMNSTLLGNEKKKSPRWPVLQSTSTGRIFTFQLKKQLSWHQRQKRCNLPCRLWGENTCLQANQCIWWEACYFYSTDYHV